MTAPVISIKPKTANEYTSATNKASNPIILRTIELNNSIAVMIIVRFYIPNSLFLSSTGDSTSITYGTVVAPVSANAGICGSMVVTVVAAAKPDISLFYLWLNFTFIFSSLSAVMSAKPHRLI